MSKTAKKEYSELKKRAMLAKQRLKMGYWQTLTQERTRVLTEMSASPVTVQRFKDLQQERVARDEQHLLDLTQARKDDLFYDKVCRLLDDDENVTNPIGRLVDREEYERLDADNKQRYILELSKKFREMRERYYRERLGETC